MSMPARQVRPCAGAVIHDERAVLQRHTAGSSKLVAGRRGHGQDTVVEHAGLDTFRAEPLALVQDVGIDSHSEYQG